jgi:hypothetical protein
VIEWLRERRLRRRAARKAREASRAPQGWEANRPKVWAALKREAAGRAALTRRVKALEERVAAIEKAKGKLVQKPIVAPPDRVRGEEQTGEAQGSARAGSAAPHAIGYTGQGDAVYSMDQRHELRA